jgi:hypothetical protein
MIHHEPHPNFNSPATQAFALEQRLSSCMAENAALHEQAMRLRLTDEERAALHWFSHYGLPHHRAAALRGRLERLA